MVLKITGVLCPTIFDRIAKKTISENAKESGSDPQRVVTINLYSVTRTYHIKERCLCMQLIPGVYPGKIYTGGMHRAIWMGVTRLQENRGGTGRHESDGLRRSKDLGVPPLPVTATVIMYIPNAS